MGAFDGGSPTGQQLRLTQGEARIESAYRRLLTSIEAERGKMRKEWQALDVEATTIEAELANLRFEVQEWTAAEREKVNSEWIRLDKLRERMSVRVPPQSSEALEMNCSGQLISLPKSALRSIEGSFLNHMFSEAFIESIPRDREGRFFLDFNPECFSLIVEFLLARLTRPDAPPPAVPPEQQQNMDLLVDVLQIKGFSQPNSVPAKHATSLHVRGDTIQALHTGWQVIAAVQPLRMVGSPYFEVKVLSNPDASKGGIAIGVCGHVPQGVEAHSIRLKHAVLYNSNNGLVGSSVAASNVDRGLQLCEGSVIGVKHDVAARTLHWYHNRIHIGACCLKEDCLEHMRVLYPIFALYGPDHKIQVDFGAVGPRASRGGSQEEPGGS